MALALPAPRNALAGAVGVAAVAASTAGLLYATTTSTYDVWGAILLAPVLLLISLPLVAVAARAEEDQRVVRLLYAALLVKLSATLVRYFVIFNVYGGIADAVGYDGAGGRIAAQLRVFDFDLGIGRLTGTGFIRLATGVLYTIIGPTRLGGFLMYSWVAFWGLLLWYRAFRIAVPDGPPRVYALLVLFTPSLVFWPSSIGKDAWMLFALGTCAYGVARLLTGMPKRGVPALAAGLWMTAMVRPHVALLVAAAATVALALRSSGAFTTGIVLKAAGVLVLGAVTFTVAHSAQSFFRVDDVNREGAEQVLSRATAKSSQGGSSYAVSGDPLSPRTLPFAVGTVLFRPLPTEAHNAQALVASAESMLLAGLALLRFRSLRTLIRVHRQPFLAFCLAYTLAFCAVFSAIGNFGILARQRVQVLPAFLALLAGPAIGRRDANA